MTFDQFQASDTAPGASACLQALWFDGRGDWKRAHEIVQEIDTAEAAWVHAYLHRKEGDEGNARYWYRTAGRSFPAGQSLEQEWRALVEAFLYKSPKDGVDSQV